MLRTGKKSREQTFMKSWEAEEESRDTFITSAWEMSSILKMKLKLISEEKAKPTGFKFSGLTLPVQDSVSVDHKRMSVSLLNQSHTFLVK